MDDETIVKEIELFKSSVMKLSREIGKAETLWNDPKYSELSLSVSNIANQSKNVIIAGDNCGVSIKKLNQIANEKY